MKKSRRATSPRLFHAHSRRSIIATLRKYKTSVNKLRAPCPAPVSRRGLRLQRGRRTSMITRNIRWPNNTFCQRIMAFLVLLAPTVANAAAILLHKPGLTAGTFATAGPETRATLLQLLHPVTVTTLGLEIDPDGQSGFAWRIYTAATDTGSGATLLAPVVLGAALLEDTGILLDDLGLQVYDHAVNVTLGAGYYIVELYIKDPGTLMRAYPGAGQALPFVTTDAVSR